MIMTAPGSHCLIAHIMIWMSLPEKEIKHPLEMKLVGRWQHCKQLNIWQVQQILNLSHHNDNHKYDYHKYDVDLLVSKLDPFTTGAYVHKCVNKTIPLLQFLLEQPRH